MQLILDFFVSENIDKKTAKEFFRKALSTSYNQQPRAIAIDKYGATEVEFINKIMGAMA